MEGETAIPKSCDNDEVNFDHGDCHQTTSQTSLLPARRSSSLREQRATLEVGAAAVTPQLIHTHDADTVLPDLPAPLRILFGLNGATLGLPNLAQMYIVNDRAQIPISLLSAYGAVSFMPWSFKPIYAFLDASYRRCQRFPSIFGTCRYGERHNLLACLLVSSGVAFVLTAAIPDHGVGLCFFLGFVRSVCTAFPEFLLGLTLLDHAKECWVSTSLSSSSCSSFGTNAKIQRQVVVLQEEEEENRINFHSGKKRCSTGRTESRRTTANSIHATGRGRETNRTSPSFEAISGVYQAQAATARNVGSFFSSVLVFLLLVVRDSTRESGQMSDGFVLLMLVATGLLPILGAIIAVRHKVGSTLSANFEGGNLSAYNTLSGGDADGSSDLQPLEHEMPHSSGAFYCDEEVIPQAEEVIPEAAGYQGTNRANQRPAVSTHLHGDGQRSSASASQSPTAILTVAEKFILSSLQLLIIWIGLKGVVQHQTAWLVVFGSLLVALLFFVAASIYEQRNYRLHSSLIQKRSALFLVLKQTVPEASYQWTSYMYYLLASAPMCLQVLSVLRSATSTLASSVYAQHIAPWCQSRRGIITVFAVTTVLSSLSSFLYLIMTRYNSQGEDSDDPKNRALQNFLIAVPISVVSSFLYELQFLPSVVLATCSVKFQQCPREPSTEHPRNRDGELNLADQREYCDCAMEDRVDTRGHFSSEANNENAEGLQYGAYVACIDFGDQLGAWITVPLVSALGITRGDWSNMSELILICIGCGIGSLLFLFLLVPRTY